MLFSLRLHGSWRIINNCQYFVQSASRHFGLPAPKFLVPNKRFKFQSKYLRTSFFQSQQRFYSNSKGKSFSRSTLSTVVAKMCPEKVDRNETPKFERLPKIARPIHYKIHLKPLLDKFSFEGSETIDIEILTKTKELKLYSSQLEICEAQLITKDKESLSLTFDVDEKQEIITFHLPKEIPAMSAQLKVVFEGALNDKMKGFYRSKFKNENGEDAYMATTQFESTFARRAFPCWDEPCYKATYDIALTVPKDKTALSNMNEISEKDNGDGWKTLQYATTPLMSSYLVAFVVGDFEYVEGYTPVDNVRVRIYTLPGRKYQGEYALEVALKAIPFFSKFFGIPYGLPKCDLIAIPDFNFGAMENWGLVTYREVYLLLDPAKSTSFGKEHITLVVAHELAHMWFGNLTTMEWWTDLWLKEGYATWMEYYFTEETYPQFDIFSQFLSAEALKAMSLDGLKNSHPIEVPINDPNEIEEIYDAVSYSKSASLIRMLHDYLGDDVFRRALQNYLKKYSFKNTITQNLWDSLSEVSGKNVCDLMSTWTKQMGFPLIKVSATFADDKTTLHLEQERFLSDGSIDTEGTVWQVPISVSSSSKKNAVSKFLLTKKTDSFVLDNVGADDWIKLNSEFTGFYKVQYSQEMLKKLTKPLSDKVLKTHDRVNICGDLFSLVRCGKMSAVDYLNTLNGCQNETDFMVWSEIDSGLDTLQNVVQRTDYKPKFDAFCRNLYSNISKSLGWQPKEKEGHTVGMLRPLVLRRLGSAGDEETIRTARKHFRAFVDEGKDMTPDLRSMVFGIVGTYDGEQAQDELKKIFENSDFSEIQRQCLVAIGRSRDVNLQQRALEYAFDSNKVRLQDSYLLIAGLTTSKIGQQTFLAYFKRNMNDLVAKFGSANSALFMHLIKMAVAPHCSESIAKEVEEFFKEHPDVFTAANRPINQSLEKIRLNVALLKRDGEAMKAFFNSA